MVLQRHWLLHASTTRKSPQAQALSKKSHRSGIMSKKKKKQQNVEPKAEPEQKKPFIKGGTFRAYIGFAIIIVDLGCSSMSTS